MTNRIFAIALALLSIQLTTGNVQAQAIELDFSHVEEADIDSIFADYLGDEPTAGCAAGVTHHGELIFAKGYGMANLDYGIPIAPDSRFMIASISKQFAAAALLMMEQEGLLDLDESLHTYIPELPDYEPKITARQIIHHTSGMRDLFSLLHLKDVGLDNTTSPEAALELIAGQSGLNFEPNTDYNYSNSGYFVMSVLVENLTGMTLDEYTQKHFFKPIGMDHTHFHDSTERIVPNRAESYRPTANGEGRFYRDNISRVGARGLFTTIEDFAKWDANFIENRSNLENFTEKMTRVGVYNNGNEMNYAAGLRLSTYRTLDTVGHGGNYMGFRSNYVRFPDYETGFIVFCNRSNINPASHTRDLSDLFLREVFEEIFEEYTGTFENRNFRTGFRIELEDGELIMRRGLREEQELTWRDDDQFSAGSYEVHFTREGGEISGFKMKTGRTGFITFEKQ
jgi:CubicO group peptidase (beta-lactamase class C family)